MIALSPPLAGRRRFTQAIIVLHVVHSREHPLSLITSVAITWARAVWVHNTAELSRVLSQNSLSVFTGLLAFSPEPLATRTTSSPVVVVDDGFKNYPPTKTHIHYRTMVGSGGHCGGEPMSPWLGVARRGRLSGMVQRPRRSRGWGPLAVAWGNVLASCSHLRGERGRRGGEEAGEAARARPRSWLRLAGGLAPRPTQDTGGARVCIDRRRGAAAEPATRRDRRLGPPPTTARRSSRARAYPI